MSFHNLVWKASPAWAFLASTSLLISTWIMVPGAIWSLLLDAPLEEAADCWPAIASEATQTNALNKKFLKLISVSNFISHRTRASPCHARLNQQQHNR